MNFYEYPQCQEYSCIHTPYNDSTFYETLESSGALSLGTTAGTNRSISGEFGGSTPHAMSEYYNKADFIACGRANSYGSYTTYTFAENGTGLSEVSVPAGDCGFHYSTAAVMCACANNGNCSGIASGTHKFSDFYGDERAYPVREIYFCMWEMANASIRDTGSNLLSIPHTCSYQLIANSVQGAGPLFFFTYANSTSYVKGTIVYTNAAGTVMKSATLKFHGGSS